MVKPQGWRLLCVAFVVCAGCSTLSGGKRVMSFSLAGAGAGAVSGAALSPNEESRALNALVFGLSGALVGGGLALLTDPNLMTAETSDLKKRELGSRQEANEYLVLPEQELPEFLQRRVQPAIIEEFVEKDHVTDEGTLHEPHRAYRIKRPAELFASPTAVPSNAPTVEGARK